jgi:capsular polysaccharide transport system ATP-binding protein
VIILENVTKRYSHNGISKTVLNRINLKLAKGRNIGLIGRNGAGKSTLLRLIAGTEEPDSGRIVRHSNVSWPLGFLGSFHGHLSGRANVRFIARIYGQDVDEVMDFVQDFSELGSYIDMPVRTYSSGMRSRLAFGVSMAMWFETYLVDEITAVGDLRFQERCQEVFMQRRQHSDLIMVSHDATTLRNYCDKGVIVANGEITVYDDIEEAIAVHERNMRADPADSYG